VLERFGALELLTADDFLPGFIEFLIRDLEGDGDLLHGASEVFL
jgi:hypothetical protein